MSRHRSTDRSRTASVVALLAGAVLGGCAGTMNAEPGLLGVTLPALAPEIEAGVRPHDGPSLQGLDRRNWPMQTVLVPAGQVETNPTYVETIVEDRTLPRQRGEYPSLRTMLDESGSIDQQWLAAAAEYPVGAAQLVAWPVRMIAVTPPNAVVRGSAGGFARMPSADLTTPRLTTDPWVWVTPQPGALPLPVAPVLGDDDGSTDTGSTTGPDGGGAGRP